MDVPMTYGVESRSVPTAMHVVSRGQAIALSWVPLGIVVGAVQSWRSTVLSVVPPPPSAIPDTTHVVVFAHDMAVSEFTEASTIVAQ